VRLYVVRHAHAGHRSSWSGDDRLRPLSKKGRRQAKALATELADADLVRLLSSPSVRCVETLEPLAEKVGFPVEDDRRLAEGSDCDDVLGLVEELRRAGGNAAICSHGDVIPELLSRLRINGIVFHHDLTWPKGSVWALTSNGAHWTDADYLHLPATKP
jgi:broad specificity phosphatase PhoE